MHVAEGTYLKCITVPFSSDALDWCCVDGCKFLHAHDGFMLMPNEQTKRKLQQKSLCIECMNTTYLLVSFNAIIFVFKQNIDTSKHSKRKA